jgi:hypothetical protein
LKHLSSLSAWCYRIITVPVLLLALIVFILFLLFVLPSMAGRLADLTGVTMSPDTSFIYSAGELYVMAEAYGETGRSYYIYQRFTFDLVWPAVYLFFYVAVITSLFRVLPEGHLLRLVNLLPFAGVLFDLLENSSAAFVMHRYPLFSPVAANLAPLFTAAKWVLVGASSVGVIVGIFLVMLKPGNKKKQTARPGRENQIE